MPSATHSPLPAVDVGASPGAPAAAPSPGWPWDIAICGVEIADADGLDAVSMKAIAERLDLTPMSLYRYVEARRTSTSSCSTGLRPLRPDWPPKGDWRAALRHGRWQSSTVSSHTLDHCCQQPAHRPGPPHAAVDRRGYSGVRRHRTTDAQRLSTLLLISGFTRNHVRMSADMGAFDPERASSADHYTTVLSQVIDADRYPNLSRSVASGCTTSTTAASTSSTRAALGLDLILDGVAARIVD